MRFDPEIALVCQNEELMALLTECSHEKKTYTLQQVREQLGLVLAARSPLHTNADGNSTLEP